MRPLPVLIVKVAVLIKGVKSGRLRIKKSVNS